MTIRFDSLALWLGSAMMALLSGCETSADAIGRADISLIPESADGLGSSELCPKQYDARLFAAEASDDGTCGDLPEGTLCAYQMENGWKGYVCGCYTEGRFSEVGVTGPENAECPNSVPTKGDVCDSEIEAGPCVYFPNVFASCNEEGKWQVWDLGDAYECPRLEEE
jgi:hypothetical protein